MMKDAKSKILYKLAPILCEQNIGQDVVVIAKAKLPIVKFNTFFGNSQVDFRISQSNGLAALEKVDELPNDVDYLLKTCELDSNIINIPKIKVKDAKKKQNCR
ncbi:uncharacterized protein MELLADRAFT_88445 [Melampsora larici-populina 98AG31]|uniref:Uncharacterized protein n=1 Tax=Melampsora larici-populina (strain 98AG31 / pathotype 3-4-7) TaxID=747676 RepID=F4RRR6_MELLP|nr:uncharacterized protein MELLADRAFT_88445 [Melampsora larici-populina 98AG31]EGG04979.1 hypothetical protein MELLADRAFT_88445 [Melampsora larici-populina 98AG31]